MTAELRKALILQFPIITEDAARQLYVEASTLVEQTYTFGLVEPIASFALDGYVKPCLKKCTKYHTLAGSSDPVI